MIGLMEPEICTKMLKKLSEKVRAKFPATTHGYSMVKFSCLNDAFLKLFLTASKPSRRRITAAVKREEEKGTAKKIFQKSRSLKIKQVQKSDRINSDRQSRSDQLGSTLIDSDRLGSRKNIKLNEILKLLPI